MDPMANLPDDAYSSAQYQAMCNLLVSGKRLAYQALGWHMLM